MKFKLFNKPCVCCNNNKNKSKWNKCLKQGKCPKPSKPKANNVLSRNGGNKSSKMRLASTIRRGKYTKPCRCNKDWENDIKQNVRDRNCNFIDRYGNILVSGPTITIVGSLNITDPSNVLFNDPGVLAFDHLSRSLPVTTTITPSIDLNTLPYSVGTYKIVYKATDRFSQSMTAERNVTFI